MSGYSKEVENFSSNPRMRKMYAEQLKIYGSMDGIMRAVYGSNSSSASSSEKPNISSSSTSDSKPAGSSGNYMVHCYYGSQPGNKITTVIG